MSVPERLLTILERLRRRVLAIRAAEAAAVGATVGALVAAAIMSGRILVARYPLLSAGLSGLAALAGASLAAHRRLRRRLGGAPSVQWCVAILLAGAGSLGAIAALTGTLESVGKNWLLLLVPAGALAASLAAVLTAPSLAQVAAEADRRLRTRERLATACEVPAGDPSPFARGVRDQALALARTERVGRVSLWTRTPATLGALGLAILAAGLTLPWQVLASQDAARRERWERVSRQGADLLQQPLARLSVEQLAADPRLAETIRQVRRLTDRLRRPNESDAGQWAGNLIELGQLAEALRGAVASGRLDARTAQEVAELIEAIQEVAARMADGMGEPPPEYARMPPEVLRPPPVQPPATAPAGYATVYHPAYADLAPATGPGEIEPAPSARPVIPQIPYDEAWAEARKRAGEALQRQDVPARYRAILRAYFQTD